jgi:hypothetical protein
MQHNSKLLANPAVIVPACAFALIVTLFCGSPAIVSLNAAQEASSGERETALKGFTERVNAYVDFKKKIAQGLKDPKPGDRATGAAEVVENTLAVRIQEARKGAKPGDIFGDAGPYFKRIIERDTRTRWVRDAYNAMQEVPSKSPIEVNAVYPPKAALATVPPLILVNLPRLPDGLEYRFMGRDMILRDREANIVVDFIVGAVPVLK